MTKKVTDKISQKLIPEMLILSFLSLKKSLMVTRTDHFKHHQLIFSDCHEKNISKKRLFVCFLSLILLETSKVLFLSLKS